MKDNKVKNFELIILESNEDSGNNIVKFVNEDVKYDVDFVIVSFFLIFIFHISFKKLNYWFYACKLKILYF